MAEQNYFQKEIETMPIEEMKKLQSEKLVKQVKHVYENVAYYRDLMDKKALAPMIFRALRICTSCPSSPRMTCGKLIPTV